MKIVIAGAGEVGLHLGRLLSDQAQDIVLIDCDQKRLQYAESHIDVIVNKGDATSVAVLKQANVPNCDLFIAATAIETTNITSALMSKKLGATKVIARISNNELLQECEQLDFKGLGIDAMFSPEQLASVEIEHLIRRNALTDAFEFEKGKLSLVGIALAENAPIANKTIREAANMSGDLQYMAIALRRASDGSTVIPRGDTKVLPKDYCYFISQNEGLEKIYKLTGNSVVKYKNVMILGASKIGVSTAKELSKDYNVKLIESNRDKGTEVAEKFSNVLVIHGDGRDSELLEEENIDNMDVFVAVTGSSETNIMACLVAKSHGVKKTVALVENMEYIHLSQKIGINTFINKKQIAASTIYRYVRRGNVLNSATLRGMEAEILEYEAKAGSRITQKTIKDLKFPKSAVIGGALRGDQALITMGDFQAQPGDKLVVFCLPEAVKKVESFFN